MHEYTETIVNILLNMENMITENKDKFITIKIYACEARLKNLKLYKKKHILHKHDIPFE